MPSIIYSRKFWCNVIISHLREFWKGWGAQMYLFKHSSFSLVNIGEHLYYIIRNSQYFQIFMISELVVLQIIPPSYLYSLFSSILVVKYINGSYLECSQKNHWVWTMHTRDTRSQICHICTFLNNVKCGSSEYFKYSNTKLMH